MALTKYKLGKLIYPCDERNADGVYTIDDIKGISTGKKIQHVLDSQFMRMTSLLKARMKMHECRLLFHSSLHMLFLFIKPKVWNMIL